MILIASLVNKSVTYSRLIPYAGSSPRCMSYPVMFCGEVTVFYSPMKLFLAFEGRKINNSKENSPDSSTRNRNTWCGCCKSRKMCRTPYATAYTGACGIPCAISQLISSYILNLVNAQAKFLCAMEDRVARHHEFHPLASLIIRKK